MRIHRFLALILSISTLEVSAKDFGKLGNIFEIKEQGFLFMIYEKLKNIDMEKHKKKIIEDSENKIKEPPPLKGIRKTSSPRSFIFDPTHIVLEDIKLPNGDVIHKAGTRVNPLDHMAFDRKLFFIDARDKNQVEWLKQELTNTGVEIKIILVAGRPLDLSEELNLDIYFDQFAELITKFGITQVPATVSQKNSEKFLRIEEIYCEKD
jgi:conjugal transfer pilus assembly protein TraW